MKMFFETMLPSLARWERLCLLLLLITASPGCLAGSSPDVPAPAYHTREISYSADGFTIEGHKRILLIGTLSYFRLDPSDWDRWLTLFAQSGFNTVDCIVPWNFHEPTEGQFDFHSPTHDLPRFLRLCRKHHLYVFVRTGPYICDEWDGGGLPAWLIPKGPIHYRQNDPVYLRYVREWMKAVDKVVAPLQITHGGPVILYQVENELDYYPCNDPTGYVGALGGWSRTDGIDVPITACIGWKGLPIQKATGDADGILPTANLYVSDDVEAAGRAAIDALHAESTVSGKSMADLPAICSETGRDENTLRRLLASGLKGVAPFDFAGGSNFLYGNGENNWRRPASYVATSIDFGGMINFAGQKTPNWYAAQRLAGFVNTFSDLICEARSDTDWEGGFSVSNSDLGAREGLLRRRLYRLSVPGTSTMFVFLWNGTGDSQPTTVTTAGITIPRHSNLAVSPYYDQILPINIDLSPWGLTGWTLRYSSSEIERIESAGQTTQITLVGDQGAQGEVSLAGPRSSGLPITLLGADGASPAIFNDSGDWTAVYTVGATRAIQLSCGTKRLVLSIENRDMPDRPVARSAVDLAGSGGWRTLSSNWPARPAFDDHAWQLFTGADPPTMESAGILHGSAWYRTRFSLPAGVSSTDSLRFSHGGDIVSAYMNGVYLGTKNGQGDELEFDTKGSLHSGENVLAVRVETWGHSNFEEQSVPSLNLGSPRGIWGEVRLGDALIAPIDGWRVQREDISAEARPLDADAGKSAAQTRPLTQATLGAPGTGAWLECPIQMNGDGQNQGFILHIVGANVLGTLFFNGHGAGRYFLGPQADPHLVGGPSNSFYIPPGWMRRPGDNCLLLFAIPTDQGASLSQIEWTSAG